MIDSLFLSERRSTPVNTLVWRLSSTAMLWQSSYSIWSFLCLLTLHQIPAASGIICDPGKYVLWFRPLWSVSTSDIVTCIVLSEWIYHAGEKATSDRNRCERCPEDQYNPAKTESKECHNCDPCGRSSFYYLACAITLLIGGLKLLLNMKLTFLS